MSNKEFHLIGRYKNTEAATADITTLAIKVHTMVLDVVRSFIPFHNSSAMVEKVGSAMPQFLRKNREIRAW